MKTALIYSFFAAVLFATSAHAAVLDTRHMTCDEVRSVVRDSGSRGVPMYSQLGYSVVFAPRAASCYSGYRAEGAFVHTRDFPGPRLCPAGWACVRDQDHGHR